MARPNQFIVGWLSFRPTVIEALRAHGRIELGVLYEPVIISEQSITRLKHRFRVRYGMNVFTVDVLGSHVEVDDA